ncbi:MAG: nickel pincer cofactor biosynthesis protein LarC [Eubacteriales bacterium]|jgi:uncharacterized protein (TIGR00299 family) protein|nr:nickel pincer cofactor biosynthesis protein LarC [Bacillota bacterium]MBV1727576.1 nickel pincer cofactor biosynthesis protein LarC [Desulforudis sp.]MDQ7789685.1 nickel pincer cofactor biosynthesis protein LarC [Clostridia bacterium]MDZ4043870.1 nickel pincer cofactor biosynthesis protein LarC [Eubacteriales bacterium]MBU4534120.1 nickel pincer cofactor biosynthesis protein LarC [Bacillota bacterium]
MRVLYWDCFAGISGDMALGSLIDLGVDPGSLQSLFINIPGCRIEVRPARSHGIAGTSVRVVAKPNQPYRRLPDVLAIIDTCPASERTRHLAKSVFHRLGEAEAKVHGVSPEEIHFHEVGAVDAIVEIVGVVAALEMLGVERVYASPLPMSTGFVRCAHGILPVPAPAVLELVKGLPTKPMNVEGEMVTPTGAALVAVLAAECGPMPPLRPAGTGYGAGTRAFPFPNMLRAVLGDLDVSVSRITETIVVLETNIDDVNPELYPYFIERLLAAGVREAFYNPVAMKKGRAGVKLTVLTEEKDIPRITDLLIQETGTLGIRIHREERITVPRKIYKVETPFGPVRIKVAQIAPGQLQAKPEFEDCRHLAETTGTPLRTITAAAQKEAERLLSELAVAPAQG